MTTYKIDAAHSEITFRVKHLMITNVTGNFREFQATMNSEAADFSDAEISFEANINSINTGNDQRDGHLKSDDFFNAELYPKMTFTSKGLSKKSDSVYEMKGDLTIRNITKSVSLEVTFGGTMTDPWGQVKAGFEITGMINRKDFELKWSATTEAGGIVVSDEVKLQLSVQMIRQN